MLPRHLIWSLLVACGLVGFAATARAAVDIIIDKSEQQMRVSVDGELRWVWPVSTGRKGYDTPNGAYTAFRMEEDHYSKEWDDAPMPHSIFFTRAGHAVHGTDLVKRLGHPASHGCVRLSRENAAQLFALVKQHNVLKTRVVVEGVLPPPPAPAAIARRNSPAPAQDYTASHRPRQLFEHSDSAAYDSRWRSIPEPAQRATREPPPRAGRVYVQPPGAAGPRYSYDPRAEIIEESYVNGMRVRRRYYRPAPPQGFFGQR